MIPNLFEYVADRLQIDQRWSVRTPDSLVWWAGALAHRLTAEPPRDLAGVEVATLHIHTDLLTGVAASAATWERLAAINRFATLSAYVADVAARTVGLHASVTVTADNWPMARVLAVHAAALQVADAHAEAAELASAFGATIAASAHPSAGARSEPDEMLTVVDVYQARGREPSPFTTAELARLVHLEPRPWLSASSFPSRLEAQLEFAKGQPARLTLDANHEHPALGSGLLITLAPPIEPDAAIAQRLNALERHQPDAHQLGAWSSSESEGLSFTTFVPAAAYLPELARALVYHAAARNEWAREVLFPK